MVTQISITNSSALPCVFRGNGFCILIPGNARGLTALIPTQDALLNIQNVQEEHPNLTVIPGTVVEGTPTNDVIYISPDYLVDDNYQGVWDASSGADPHETPEAGWYWRVTVAGSHPLDGIATWEVGDHVKWNGVRWMKIVTYATGARPSHETLPGILGGAAGEHYHLTAEEYARLRTQPSHNALSGIMGGTTNERYHLTAEEHASALEIIRYVNNGYIQVAFDILSFSDGESANQLMGVGVWKDVGELTFTATFSGIPTLAEITHTPWYNALNIIDGSAVNAEVVNYPASIDDEITFTLTTTPAGSKSETVTFSNTTLFGIVGDLTENGANEATNYSKTISAGVGEYLQFGIPDRLTDIAQVLVGGITAAFNADQTTVTPTLSAPESYTNSAGYEEDFVYITSILDNLGAFSSAITLVNDSTPRNYICYGKIASETINEAQIESLANKPISNDITQTWNSVTCGEGEYFWLCWPTRLGSAFAFYDNDTGLGMSMESAVTVSVTNPAGFTENYYAVRTTFANLGALNVRTS